MEIYLVGGAVRDALLGLPVTERDWVVVGATPEDMLKLGFQPVGKDFPVFLHPKTHEEYALARTERKTGKGYKGFVFYSAPDVGLVADLHRRDLTINAIAQTAEGELIDPYHGQPDLKNKILRHVSPAFQEDPVRILRIARFAARFEDFSVHPETMQLMKNMVANGEVNALVPERVWQEFSRALSGPAPMRFLEVLEECGAWAILFPEITLSQAALHGLENAVKKSTEPSIRFAALLHAIDEQYVVSLCERYRVPREYADLAQLTVHWLARYRGIDAASSPKTLWLMLKSIDARRRPERFEYFLLVCNAVTDFMYEKTGRLLKTCVQEMQKINLEPLKDRNLKGKDFQEALEALQLSAISDILRTA